jgi:hypothetical protein
VSNGAPDGPAPDWPRDSTVRTLAGLFREHPTWVQAARHLADRAESDVSFTHRPNEPWRLVRRRGQTLLLPGRAADPDFALAFTPGAVARLARVHGDVGDFAVALFSCLLEPDAANRIGLRIVAPFRRLVRRGYVRLLLAAGPKVVAFGSPRGVRTLADLRRFVRDRRGTAFQGTR